MRNVEKWSNTLLKFEVFITQDFKSMFSHFSTLYMKGLIQESSTTFWSTRSSSAEDT